MPLTTKSKTSRYSRQRRGEHHRHSKQYVKTYWPYLPVMFFIAGSVLATYQYLA